MKKSELIGLVEQMQDGSRDAFEKLYEEYYDRLYFFVLKNVGNKEAAEDITQDVFMKSMEKIQTLENPENYVTWLHTIAYRMCTDLFRSRRRDAYFDTDEEMEDAMENHSLNEPIMVPEDYATDKDTARQLKAMIDSLKPDMKSALILYYYNDMSLTDISKTMGISETNVKQKLFRARKKLKEKIEQLGGKGIMMVAVPMDEMLHRTVSPKYAASVAAKSGTAAVGTGLAAGKVAGIAAAAVMAVGIPVALGNIGKDKHDLKGDMQLYDSSAASSVTAVESSSSSAVESSVAELIASSLADSSVLENNTSSRPEESSSSAPTDTSSAAPITVTATVNASSMAETSGTAPVQSQAETTADNNSQIENVIGVDEATLYQYSTTALEAINSASYNASGLAIRGANAVYDEDFEPCGVDGTSSKPARYYYVPNYDADDLQRIRDVLNSGYFSEEFARAHAFDRAENALVEHDGEYYFDSQFRGTGNSDIYNCIDGTINAIDENTFTIEATHKDYWGIAGEGTRAVITLKRTADENIWQIVDVHDL